MAYWDSTKKQIISFKPQPAEDYPGWQVIDCGCCAGVEWGGDYPRECRTCRGGGVVYHHKPSGVLAEYPGGKFLGKQLKSNQK